VKFNGEGSVELWGRVGAGDGEGERGKVGEEPQETRASYSALRLDLGACVCVYLHVRVYVFTCVYLHVCVCVLARKQDREVLRHVLNLIWH
jgi:hypothetical protein